MRSTSINCYMKKIIKIILIQAVLTSNIYLLNVTYALAPDSEFKQEQNLTLSPLKDMCKSMYEHFLIAQYNDLSDEYKIGGVLNKDKEPILVFAEHKTSSRKVAYIFRGNWGNALLLPLEDNIDAFTDGAQNCPVLMMSLVDSNNKPYIFLAHIFAGAEKRQINHFIEQIMNRNMQINEVVYSCVKGKEDKLLTSSLGSYFKEKPLIVVKESSLIVTNALVTENGWVLHHGNNPPIAGSWKNTHDDYSSGYDEASLSSI